ncbi:hypothetical protein PAESOLCIP111_06538 [Paenibacillus solanacearum]|uniref:WYL domain-containing protein n=1 Tax=Paenibacillus solanacearum TaxID=2048548 RepID=A0A916K8G8_9BACL|nr:hypothetical protein [Paenibacillus solanacearum]CAG7652443.1 hypothetical protein PAESOLCIP111_06538 [Paenibacillus solanacearum]
MKFERYVGSTVEIIYMDRNKRISQRRITVVSVQDGRLRAHCLAQQAPRLFRIDSILAVHAVPGRGAG